MNPALLLAILAPALAQAPDPPAVRRYAVVIGANDGGPYRVRLRYAHDDARHMTGVLTDLGGVAPEDRWSLFDPDVLALETTLDDLQHRLEADEAGRTEVVFYYSGHSDETGLLLGEEHYPYKDLRARMEALSAEVRIGILDSCSSGGLVRSKGGKLVTPFLADVSRDVTGTAYITSASADESAQEADRIGGSYFTYYLVSGLRGAADISGDGRVSLHEAYRYAFDETLAWTSATQHGPQHANYDFQLVGAGDVVLTDLQRTSAAIVLAEGTWGRVFVRDADGDLVAELIKEPDREIALGVAPGRYQATFSRDGQYATVPLELSEGGRQEVTPMMVAWNAGEVAVARGGEPLPPTYSRGMHFSLGPTEPPPNSIDRMALSLGAGRSYALEGMSIAVGAHTVDNDARGMMAALGANFVGGDLDGVQTALGVNQVSGDGGVQLAIGANLIEGRMNGAQVAVGFNYTGLQAEGVQVAVGANLAAEPLQGAQVAIGGNIAPRSVYGVQYAIAGFNYAEGVRGAQIGIVNVGGLVRGAQIGIINYGTRVRGAQIGIVNIAGESHAPIGLLSFVKRGRYDLSLFSTESALLNADFKMGGRYVYTFLGGGYSTRTNAFDMGGGVGFSIPAGPAYVDIDFGGFAHPDPTTALGSPIKTFTGRGRLTVGLHLARNFALIAGASLNYRWWTDGEPVAVPPPWINENADTLILWPGFFAGVSF